jgi:transposase
MDLPIPAAILNQVPESVRDALLAFLVSIQNRLDHLEQENLQLRQENQLLRTRVADLERQLQANSSNSHKPPSSDPDHLKPESRKPKSKHKPGGQPGHPKSERQHLPADKIIDLHPNKCQRCQEKLTGTDSQPLIHQYWEFPIIRPHVIEYRLHRLTCHHCGQQTSAQINDANAQECYGPNLKAMVTFFTGVCQLSKSQTETVFEDLLNTPISTGQICAIEAEATQRLAPVVSELKAELPKHNVNMDETGWKQSGKRHWLWVAVTAWFTVFEIFKSRGRKSLQSLLGTDYQKVLTSDRYRSYDHLENRQLCWSHLLRDFQAITELKSKGSEIAGRLLVLAGMMFEIWDEVRTGKIPRSKGVKKIENWVIPDVEIELRNGVGCGCAVTAGLCETLLEKKDYLWTFCEVEGVEPTNNAAERALRPAVIWRKKSQGTRSEVGSQYVSRMLTVAATCKQQNRGIWQFLSEVFQATPKQQKSLSLLPNS